MVVAKLHEIYFGRGTMCISLTDEPVAKVIERFMSQYKMLRVEDIEWIKTREVVLTADKPETAAHEISRFI